MDVHWSVVSVKGVPWLCPLYCTALPGTILFFAFWLFTRLTGLFKPTPVDRVAHDFRNLFRCEVVLGWVVGGLAVGAGCGRGFGRRSRSWLRLHGWFVAAHGG